MNKAIEQAIGQIVANIEYSRESFQSKYGDSFDEYDDVCDAVAVIANIDLSINQRRAAIIKAMSILLFLLDTKTPWLVPSPGDIVVLDAGNWGHVMAKCKGHVPKESPMSEAGDGSLSYWFDIIGGEHDGEAGLWDSPSIVRIYAPIALN